MSADSSTICQDTSPAIIRALDRSRSGEASEPSDANGAAPAPLEAPLPPRRRHSRRTDTQSEEVNVGGVGFHCVTMAEAVAHIMEIVRHADRPAYVCTGNLDHLALLQYDAEFKRVYEGASLVLADGMPILWLSRLGMRQKDGRRLRERVAGSDLFWELGRASAEAGLRLFFLGGAPGAADAAAEALQNRYPGARVCNTYCPPKESFDSPEEQERIFALVHAAAPDVLLVGLGAPKQEKWIAANRARLRVPVSIGVGGSFDLAAGLYQRAPEWMQRCGLEWAYRLVQDPGRLARRYLGRDLPCLIRLAAQAVTDRSGSAINEGGGSPVDFGNG